jgi:hypothetical protein
VDALRHAGIRCVWRVFFHARQWIEFHWLQSKWRQRSVYLQIHTLVCGGGRRRLVSLWRIADGTNELHGYLGGGAAHHPSQSSTFHPVRAGTWRGRRESATSGGIHAAENSILIMPGAGIDLDLHHKLAIRAVQVNYLATRFAQNNGSTGTQNNFRISAGIVFRFGYR